MQFRPFRLIPILARGKLLATVRFTRQAEVRHSHNSRFLKRVGIVLLSLQMHLLWVAVLHSHEFSEAMPAPQSTRGQTQDPDLPAAAKSHYCVVCQIVRQSAVRPALAAPVPPSVALTRLGLGASPGQVNSQLPPSIRGRAPPLA